MFLIKIKITIIKTYSRRNAHINNINMLYSDRIDFSEVTDINKTITLKSVIFLTSQSYDLILDVNIGTIIVSNKVPFS